MNELDLLTDLKMLYVARMKNETNEEKLNILKEISDNLDECIKLAEDYLTNN